MNILLIGSGGREHALAWKIAQSPCLKRLYALPGNPGTAELGTNVEGNPEDLSFVVELSRKKEIDLVVIGPEVPLALGMADVLRDAGFLVYGPSQSAAQIESSKAFAKNLMTRYNIPTADYQNFTNIDSALAYFKQRSVEKKILPVIKASGLAAGKGVILPESLSQAESVLRKIMLEKCFGEAGVEVVIEERLVGREVTVLAFTDGFTVLPMPASQDHKRLLEGNQGPNTGGMGVFAPSPFASPDFLDWVVSHVIQPAVDGLRNDGMPFVGTVYAGMILTENGPKTLEFNCRFGDPETQVVLPLLDADILAIFMACAEGRLQEVTESIRWSNAASVCVVLASDGYPGGYHKGFMISGLDRLPEGVVAFHAGTAQANGGIVTYGGRVLGITATATTMAAARQMAYAGVERINFEGMQYRRDIAEGF
jgi:phosphoribosylamine--glycine ligase